MAFIFHMRIPCGWTLSLVPGSRSSVSVKYQGHIFFEKGRHASISVHKRSLFHLYYREIWSETKRDFSADVLLLLKVAFLSLFLMAESFFFSRTAY